MTVDTFIEAARTVLNTGERVPGNGCKTFAEYHARQCEEVRIRCSAEVRILCEHEEAYAWDEDVPGWVWDAYRFFQD
jgi:hypothetical protein